MQNPVSHDNECLDPCVLNPCSSGKTCVKTNFFDPVYVRAKQLTHRPQKQLAQHRLYPLQYQYNRVSQISTLHYIDAMTALPATSHMLDVLCPDPQRASNRKKECYIF
ncbi:hypothetical protein DPMN_037865 [Dreissena polymorpha]|uniref:Uncharacterized protein n=1 Tax=Dreissena polymorpha TaxID=45954 RepID=A0A9D4MEC7_DREPO|nr:hypothetical protein DPMN_037865 [Dreissena polymorpha]